MYTITATRSVARVKATRAGHRGLRRNPLIVMKDGSTIRLAPGKSVTISEEAYNFNRKLLDEFSTCIVVRSLHKRKEEDTIIPPPVPPALPEEDEDGEDTLDAPEESITVNAVEDKVPEDLKVEVSETTVKKRRKSSNPEVKLEGTEDKPKRRRRSRKSDK